MSKNHTVRVTVTHPDGQRHGYLHRWMADNQDTAMSAAVTAEAKNRWPSHPIPKLASSDPDEPISQGSPLCEPDYEKMFGGTTSLR